MGSGRRGLVAFGSALRPEVTFAPNFWKDKPIDMIERELWCRFLKFRTVAYDSTSSDSDARPYHGSENEPRAPTQTRRRSQEGYRIPALGQNLSLNQLT